MALGSLADAYQWLQSVLYSSKATIGGQEMLVAKQQSVVAAASSGATTSFPSGAATVVNFDTVEIDTNNAITTGAAWHFKAPMAGKYLVTATVMLAGPTATTNMLIELYVNGVYKKTGSLQKSLSVAHAYIQGSISCVVSLKGADSLDVRLYQDSGSTLTNTANTTESHISIVKVAD